MLHLHALELYRGYLHHLNRDQSYRIGGCLVDQREDIRIGLDTEGAMENQR